MADLTGKILGERYRVDLFLGRGGMADVYKVWDLQRAAPLALKVLLPELAKDAIFLNRFEREARALEMLQHPNIVRFYGLEEADGLAFILMDFIDGLTLRKEIALNRHGMSPARILEILQPVCAALFFAHQMGMVHCDIKPANIMIHRNGAVFLTDFGIARMRESITPGASNPGTPAYMAPEQIAGQEPAPAVDIYALGVVLFEMLTGGRRPFTGEAAQGNGSLAEKILWEKRSLPLPSPGKLNPAVPAEFETIVARCLDADPRQRYATALELLDALKAAASADAGGEESLTHGEPVLESASAAGQNAPSPDPSAAGTSPKPGPGKRRFWPWLAVVGIGALLAILGLSLFPGTAHAPTVPGTPPAQAVIRATTPSTASPAPLPSRAMESTPSPASTSGAAVSITTASITGAAPLGGGQWIAFASDRSGTVQIWIMDPGDPENPKKRRQLTDEPGGACQPAWSPDGQALAYTTPCEGASLYYINGTIKIVGLDGRRYDPQLPRNSFDPTWAAASGENLLAYTALVVSKSEIHVAVFPGMDVAHRKLQTLRSKGEKNAQPAWSRDGAFLTFISSDESHVDRLWTMEQDGSSPEVIGEKLAFSDPTFSPDSSQVLASVNPGDNRAYLALFDRSNLNLGEKRLLTADISMRHASISPDGQWVVFWSDLDAGQKGEIMLASLDGKDLRRLTNNDKRDFQPAWSPR